MRTSDLELNENEAVFFDKETLNIHEYKVYSEFHRDWVTVPLEKIRPADLARMQDKVDAYAEANPLSDAKAELDLDAMRDDALTTIKNIFKPGGY